VRPVNIDELNQIFGIKYLRFIRNKGAPVLTTFNTFHHFYHMEWNTLMYIK